MSTELQAANQGDSFYVIAATLTAGFARRTAETWPALEATTQPHTTRLRNGLKSMIDQAVEQRNAVALGEALDCLALLAETWQEPFGRAKSHRGGRNKRRHR